MISVYQSLAIGYVTMVISAIIAMRIVMRRLDWPKIILAGIGWPITMVVVLYLSTREDEEKIEACDRCGYEVENFDDLNDGYEFGFEKICETCWQYFHSDEYRYDLKDQAEEHRWECENGR